MITMYTTENEVIKHSTESKETLETKIEFGLAYMIDQFNLNLSEYKDGIPYPYPYSLLFLDTSKYKKTDNTVSEIEIVPLFLTANNFSSEKSKTMKCHAYNGLFSPSCRIGSYYTPSISHILPLTMGLNNSKISFNCQIQIPKRQMIIDHYLPIGFFSSIFFEPLPIHSNNFSSCLSQYNELNTELIPSLDKNINFSKVCSDSFYYVDLSITDVYEFIGKFLPWLLNLSDISLCFLLSQVELTLLSMCKKIKIDPKKSLSKQLNLKTLNPVLELFNVIPCKIISFNMDLNSYNIILVGECSNKLTKYKSIKLNQIYLNSTSLKKKNPSFACDSLYLIKPNEPFIVHLSKIILTLAYKFQYVLRIKQYLLMQTIPEAENINVNNHRKYGLSRKNQRNVPLIAESHKSINMMISNYIKLDNSHLKLSKRDKKTLIEHSTCHHNKSSNSNAYEYPISIFYNSLKMKRIMLSFDNSMDFIDSFMNELCLSYIYLQKEIQTAYFLGLEHNKKLIEPLGIISNSIDPSHVPFIYTKYPLHQYYKLNRINSAKLKIKKFLDIQFDFRSRTMFDLTRYNRLLPSYVISNYTESNTTLLLNNSKLNKKMRNKCSQYIHNKHIFLRKTLKFSSGVIPILKKVHYLLNTKYSTISFIDYNYFYSLKSNKGKTLCNKRTTDLKNKFSNIDIMSMEISEFILKCNETIEITGAALSYEFRTEIEDLILSLIGTEFPNNCFTRDVFTHSPLFRFFYIINYVVGSFLQTLTIKTLSEFINLFLDYNSNINLLNVSNVTYKHPIRFKSNVYSYSGYYPYSNFQLLISLEIETQHVQFTPCLSPILKKLENIITRIVQITSSFQIFEINILANLNLPSKNILLYIDDELNIIQKFIQEALLFSEPELKRLQSVYNVFMENLNNIELIDSIPDDQLKQCALNIKSYMDQVRYISPSTVHIGIFQVNCLRIKSILYQYSLNKLISVIQFILARYEESIDIVYKEISLIHERIHIKPETTNEYIAMLDFTDKAKDKLSNIEANIIKGKIFYYTSILDSILFPLTVEQIGNLKVMLIKFAETKKACVDNFMFIEKEKEAIRIKIENNGSEYRYIAQNLSLELSSVYQITEISRIDEVLDILTNFKNKIELLEKNISKLKENAKLFNKTLKPCPLIFVIRKWFDIIYAYWNTISISNNEIENILYLQISDIQCLELMDFIKKMRQKVHRTSAQLHKFKHLLYLSYETEKKLSLLYDVIYILYLLTLPIVKPSYCDSFFKSIGTENIHLSSNTLMVKKLWDIELYKYLKKAKELVSTAKHEMLHQQNIKNLKAELKNYTVKIVKDNTDLSFPIPLSIDEMIDLIDDRLLFIEKIKKTNQRLWIDDNQNLEVLLINSQILFKKWLSIYKVWNKTQVFLRIKDNIQNKSSNTLNYNDFVEYRNDFLLEIDAFGQSDMSLFYLIDNDIIKSKLSLIMDKLTSIHVDDDFLLEWKRRIFPRLYLVSNSFLLEKMSDNVIDLALKIIPMMYPYLFNFQYSSNKILSFTTRDGVVLRNALDYNIDEEDIEHWMVQFQKKIQESLHIEINSSFSNSKCKPLKEWLFTTIPQSVDLILRSSFVENLQQLVENLNEKGIYAMLRKLIRVNSDLISIRYKNKTLNANNSNVIYNAIILGIYHKDISYQLLSEKVSSIEELNDFPMIRIQHSDKSCNISYLNKHLGYGFEFLGNYSILPFSTQINKFMATLLIHNTTGYNTIIYNESNINVCKESDTNYLLNNSSILGNFANLCGRYLFNFNYISSLHTNHLINIFKGTASIGAWIHFRNITSLDCELAMEIRNISQQIQQIKEKYFDQLSLNNQHMSSKHITIDDKKLNPYFTCFISIDYEHQIVGARTVSSYLSNYFRPTHLLHPDYLTYIRILLTAYGLIDNINSIAEYLSQFLQICLTFTLPLISLKQLQTCIKIVSKVFHYSVNKTILELFANQFKNFISLENIPKIVDLLPFNKIVMKINELYNKNKYNVDHFEPMNTLHSNYPDQLYFEHSLETNNINYKSNIITTGPPFSGRASFINKLTKNYEKINIPLKFLTLAQLYGTHSSTSLLNRITNEINSKNRVNKMACIIYGFNHFAMNQFLFDIINLNYNMLARSNFYLYAQQIKVYIHTGNNQ